MKIKELNEKKKNVFNTVVVALAATVFILVSVLILFIPQIEIKDICYFCSGAVLALGIYIIVRYFLTEGYRRLSEYGFSEGVLFVLLGSCGLISADNMAESFLTVLGLSLLLSGVIKLQYALDLKCMEDKVWVIFFVITVLFLICDVVSILKPFTDAAFYEKFTCMVLLADGIVTIINIFYLQFRTKMYLNKNGEEYQLEEVREENNR